MLRVLSHPSDGFYEIRYREKGSPALALLMTLLFCVCYTTNRLLASFVVNNVYTRSIDGLAESGAIVGLVLLFSIGNWSVTCLLNGEGRFRDIITVVGYALIPAIIALALGTVVSRFLASGEEGFYTVIIAVGLVWTGVLVLVGIMTVHNYTLIKTLGTLILTILAMFIIVFFILLLADMVRQVYVFGYGIYTELIFRG